jgi:very-short-patch-repair endonuclease
MKENAMSDAIPSWTRRSRSPEIIRARELRRNMTSAERILWSHLRKKQIEGVRFRRQFPLGPYFADFVCLSARLIIEVDGASHVEPVQKQYDRRRTLWLGGEGFRVLRVWNDEVFGELGVVLAMIVNELRSS